MADAAFDAVAAVLKAGALPREVIEAASVIEEAGFTIIDDLLHGYGGGYLPPMLGSKSRPSAHVPDEPFRAGMVVVIQPNVVTTDGKAGVQTGEMVLITETGIEPIHAVPARIFARLIIVTARYPRHVLNGVSPRSVKESLRVAARRDREARVRNSSAIARLSIAGSTRGDRSGVNS